MPKAIEIGRAMMIAARARISVLTVRGMTISLTGRRLAADMPQSPLHEVREPRRVLVEYGLVETVHLAEGSQLVGRRLTTEHAHGQR